MMLSIGLAMTACCFAAFRAAADDDWLTDRALTAALGQPVQLTFVDGTRLELLRELAQPRRIALLLDRRVDPSAVVDCDLQHLTFLGAVFEAGRSADLGAAVVGDFVYVGPGVDAVSLPARLAAWKRDLAKLPADMRRVWQRAEPLRIPRLARPAQVLHDLAREAGLTIDGLDAIPHDLYREVQLPPLSLAERFAVLLLGFDLWPEVSRDGRSVRFIPLPKLDSFESSYPAENAKYAAAWVEQHLPEATATAKSKTVLLRGTPHEHFEFARQLAIADAATASRAGVDRTAVSLKATASRIAILRKIAGDLGVTLEVDPAAETQLAARVEVDAVKLSYPQLIAKVLDPTPLQFELSASRLRIFSR